MTQRRPSQPKKVGQPKLGQKLIGKFTRRNRKQFTEELEQVHQLRMEESADPSYIEGKEEAADEVIANTAIILFLQSITDLARNSIIESAFDHVKIPCGFWQRELQRLDKRGLAANLTPQQIGHCRGQKAPP
ncbi:hypothetical protein BGW36DRAFT_1682 [Talaromyces proteolyticus]|uniref:Uncharacterized protein n=1 Tax=Talaromyces proteolyticus TaxID=1131652 RepID=A0AAD4Q5M7_9EURO|nr:uncharacterized protein BGW36DRAFT_1682 [Talaromyces proteolyticus]KAH8704771.1 hypothetical protein BGW36DRAFT_1682 [Talaromyces proteolyticus]